MVGGLDPRMRVAARREGEGGDEDVVPIVDFGSGGKGDALQTFKQRFPDVKGRLRLQDLEPVIEVAVQAGLIRYRG